MRKNCKNKIDVVDIESFDTWSLDYTLALIILPALLQFKQQKTGIPSEFIADVTGSSHDSQGSFDFHIDTYDEAYDKACQKWEIVLDKMIWSFLEIIKDDYENLYHHGDSDISFEPIELTDPVTGNKTKYQQLVNKSSDYWYDTVGRALHEERIDEGLALFGKFYRNLWC